MEYTPYKARSCTISESETTSGWNWKVKGRRRRGERWHNVTFTFGLSISWH